MASTNPDENSYTPKKPDLPEPLGFTYDDPHAPPESESSYVPEREFVLMPLFRRLGEMLGIRRRLEFEHIYEPTAEAPRVEASRVVVADTEPAQEPVNYWAAPQAAQPLPSVAPEVPEPIALQATESEPEAQGPTYEALREIASAQFEQHPYEPAAEVQVPETRSPAPEVVQTEHPKTPQPQRVAPRTQPARQSTYSDTAKRRPVLVRSRARAPFWKRIDLAREFTPKRVAVLGGAAMAMLLISGILLARRPASEVLPPQPRVIQPGGVTLSTHPASAPTTAPAPQPRRTTSRAPRPVAAAPHRARKTAISNNEPDVVTHYYKQKPSPTKQSTVAGVRHYSDMN